MPTSRFSKSPALWAILAAALLFSAKATAADDPAAEQLGKEVGKKGWIVMALYSQEVEARRRLPDDEAGQADLYLMRPDGSEMRNITNTPDRHEFFARFSPDGKKLCGPAEVDGVSWKIVSLDIETRKATVLTKHMN